MNAPEQNRAIVSATIDGASELDRLLQRATAYSPREDLLGDKFDRMLRIAELMAKSGMAVPPFLRDNVGACFAVVQQAMRWNADPWAVALKTHVVNEMVAYESQLIGAVLNASGAIQEAALRDEYFGPWERVIGNFVERESKYKNHDGSAKTYRKLNTTVDDERGVGIKVQGTLAGESSPRVLTLQLSQASVRNSTLWADDPQQQLFYLAQKRWARKYAPGVILGLYSADELDRSEIDADPETGEIAASKRPEPPKIKALPPYLPSDFEQKLPEWKKLVTGKDGKTAEALLAKLSTKAQFSDEQRTAILALGKPAASTGDDWQPGEEELAAIKARELAEAGK